MGGFRRKKSESGMAPMGCEIWGDQVVERRTGGDKEDGVLGWGHGRCLNPWALVPHEACKCTPRGVFEGLV